MSKSQSAISKEDRFRWVQNSKKKAISLLEQVPDLARDVFEQGRLVAYLDLLSQLHYFGAANLLLIYKKYPQATNLASYNYWKSLIPVDNSRVLKREGVGQGIDLIAPFTDGEGEDISLTWYSVSVFDISQTNVKSVSCHQSKKSLPDLLEALRRVLDVNLLHPVFVVQPSDILLATGLPGFISAEKASAVYVRLDISEEVQLQWLTEAMIRLYFQGKSSSSEADRDLINCVSYCLFRIWGFAELASHSTVVNFEPSDQSCFLFLEKVCSMVRDLDEIVSASYDAACKNALDSSEIDFDDMFVL